MNDLKDKKFHIKNGVATRLALYGMDMRPVSEADIRRIERELKTRKKRVAKPTSKEKDFIELALMAAKVEYVKEFRFDKVRRWRFDFYIPSVRCGVEYNGLVFDSNKAKSSGKSRHVSITGYTKDLEKINSAILQGFKVLQYTALNHTDIVKDLNKILI